MLVRYGPAKSVNEFVAPATNSFIDFAGPYLTSMFLVVVDAHPRLLEVEKMSSTTSEKTIETLQMLLARYGVPAQLIRDNGSQLKLEEFEQFLERNGIKHITSTPYHPAANDLVERCELQKWNEG